MPLDDLKKIKLRFQVYASSVVGLFALGIIGFDNQNDALLKWAIGIVAFLLGYWLK